MIGTIIGSIIVGAIIGALARLVMPATCLTYFERVAGGGASASLSA